MYTKADLVQSGMSLPMAESVLGNIERLLDALAIPTLIAQSFSPVTRTSDTTTDAVYTTLALPTLPSGVMGLNSKLVIVTDWDVLTTGTKSVAVDVGGQNILTTALSGSVVAFKCLTEFQNANSLSAQKILNGSSYQTQTVARLSTTVDTSSNADIAIKCKWSANQADALQTITLIGYSIWHYPG